MFYRKENFKRKFTLLQAVLEFLKISYFPVGISEFLKYLDTWYLKNFYY